MKKQIQNLYDYCVSKSVSKNKKLKIVCGWDEVIQSTEPYALWNIHCSISQNIKLGKKLETPFDFLRDYKLVDEPFPKFFNNFWKDEMSNYLPFVERKPIIKYSSYGSTPNIGGTRIIEMYNEIKDSSVFYKKAPFLTIAEDLLRLIKEDKVEQIIFLSAYDKRKFPKGDARKGKIFNKTFGYFCTNNISTISEIDKEPFCYLQLVGFDSETQGQSKTDWIQENASGFDIVIDNNHNTCKKLLEMKQEEAESWDRHQSECMGCSDDYNEYECFQGEVISPYYPIVENQHNKEVLLVKNEVSGLKKEDFILNIAKNNE